MEFRLLGPLEVLNKGERVPLGGQQQRKILSILLSDPGRTLTYDRLVEALWPVGEPPENARRTAISYVSRLRSALGDGWIDTSDAGYSLNVTAASIDAVRFTELVESARAVGPDVAAEVLDEALLLWRGPVFGDLHDEFWALPTASRLDELRLAALADRIDALAARGWDARTVAEARSLVAMHPLRAPFVQRLMRGLDATGRTDEALRAFQEHREMLLDRTGLDPAPELVELDRELASLGHQSASSDPVGRALRGYVLHDVIGAGSFGTVHRATQPVVGRDVAVKVINAELADDPAFVQRFETEAQLVARLEHPHIVPLYDFWREPGGAFLVFRLLRGGTAEELLAGDGPFPLERATRVLEQVGGALGCAHAAGVVHRDVKPANILFDDDGEAYLTDFGIATYARDGSQVLASVGAREAGASAGSPMYASPEQARDGAADARADQYALAVTMWELLTGCAPFVGSSASEVVAAKLRASLPSLRSELPTASSRLDDVLRRGSAVHPDDRFATVGEFVAAWHSAVSSATRTTGDIETPASAPFGDAAATAVSLFGLARNPYKGLRPFTEADAAEFFGRTALVDELHGAVRGRRVVAVVGPSGSGKSSLVTAGLVPMLRAEGTLVASMTPGDDPFAAISRAVGEVATVGQAAAFDGDDIRRDGGVARVLAALSHTTPVVIVVDQLEELWTATDPDERAAFLATIAQVADGTDDVRVILTVRADWFDRPLRDPALGPLVAQSTFGVTPMTPAELHEAVSQPAGRIGVRFEPGLAARIVAEAVDQPGSLPLLQFTLAELFDRRTGATVTASAYDEMGGLAGSVAHHADALYGGFSATEQESTRRMFARLVTPGEGGEDTRRRARLGQLWGIDDRVVRSFVDARLLTMDRDRETREPTVEIAHEALLRSWPRLRQWLDEDRSWLRDLGALAGATRLWESGGRDDADLYRGARLAIVAEQADARSGALTPAESDFLDASMQLADAERVAADERARVRELQNRRLRRSLVGLGVVLVMALLAGAVALWQTRRADQERASAEAAALLAAENAELAERRADESDQQRQVAGSERERADQAAEEANRQRRQAEDATAAADLQRLEALAVATAGEDIGLAALLAAEAHRIGGEVSSASTLQRVLSSAGGVEATIPGVYGSGTLSRDGTTLLAEHLDGLEVWDLRTRTLVREVDFALTLGLPYDATPDLGEVVYATFGGVFLLDVATGDVRTVRRGPVRAVALSPDGDELIIADENGIAVWDVSAAAPAVVGERRYGGGVLDVAWNPNGGEYVLVTASTAVEYWNAVGAEPTWSHQPPLGSFGRLGSPSTLFSSDGRSVVVAKGELQGGGVVVRTYDTGGGQLLGPELTAVEDIGDPVWLDEQRGLIAAATAPAKRIVTLDLVNGREVPSPVTSKSANSISFSATLNRYVTVGSSGIEIRRTAGSGPLERVVELPVDYRDAIAAGGWLYSSVALENSLVAAIFQESPPATIAFDLSVDPPTSRTFEFEGLPVGADRHLLMILARMVVLDPHGEPLGPPLDTPPDTRMFRPSPDGRFFAVSRANGSVNLYRSSGELVDELRVPEITDDSISFSSFTADGERILAYALPGGWALWDTDSGELLDSGSHEELHTPRIAGNTLYAERSLDDLSILQLDPITHEPVGPPLVAASTPPASYVEGAGGTIVARSTFDGKTQVFDKASGVQLGRELSGSASVADSEFAPDGTTLMFNAGDHISLWNYDVDTWIGLACELAGRNMTRTEWEDVGPRTLEYRATCPAYPVDD